METKIEGENNPSTTQKMLKVSIIISVILFAVVLVLLIFFMYQDSLTKKILIDGVSYRIQESSFEHDGEKYTLGQIQYTPKNGKTEMKDMMVITPDNMVYFSIHTIAIMQGYSYTLGEYMAYTQETDKCHVTCDGEDVSFSAGSKEIYKVVFATNSNGTSSEMISRTEQIENYVLQDEVKLFNGELYASAEAIGIGFNSYIGMKSDTQFTVYSLTYLVDTYGKQIASSGYTPSAVFKNQRSLVNGNVIVSKGSQSQKSLYGIYSMSSASNVTDMRFDSIEYLQNVNKYVVSADGKYGILEVNENKGKYIAREVIPLEYDSISLLDAEEGLFIIKKLDNYGVIREDGATIVPAEFTQIGVGDISPYIKQGITNPYLLFGKCIPVEKNGKYGMYNIEGDKIVDANSNYIGFGCSNAETIVASGGNVLIIPEEAGLGFEGIVVRVATGRYGILSSTGAMKITAIYDSIYTVTKDTITTYYAKRATSAEPELLKNTLDAFTR